MPGSDRADRARVLPPGALRRLALTAFGLAAAGLVIAALTPLAGESQLLAWIASVRTPSSVTVARLLTELGDLWLVALVAVVLAVVVRGSPAAHRLRVLLLSSIGGSAVLITVLKLVVARPRPPGALVATVTSAYPSGHAVRAAAVHGLLVWWLSRRVRHPVPRTVAVTVTAVLAVGVALSRVWLGVHLPSEVLAGLVLGAGWLVAVVRTVGLPGVPHAGGQGDGRPDGQ